MQYAALPNALENRTALDLRFVKPILQRPDRTGKQIRTVWNAFHDAFALLIGFRSPQCYHESAFVEF